MRCVYNSRYVPKGAGTWTFGNVEAASLATFVTGGARFAHRRRVLLQRRQVHPHGLAEPVDWTFQRHLERAQVSPKLRLMNSGPLIAGIALLLLGGLVWRKRDGYFAPETWHRSRILRISGLFLFVIPGLEGERQRALHPERFRRVERLATAARWSRIFFAGVCLLVGVALFAVGLVT